MWVSMISSWYTYIWQHWFFFFFFMYFSPHQHVESRDKGLNYDSTTFIVLQSPSCIWLFSTSWTEASRLPCPSLSHKVSLLKLMSIELVMLYNHLILCRRLLLLPSVFPRIFLNLDLSKHPLPQFLTPLKYFYKNYMRFLRYL